MKPRKHVRKMRCMPTTHRQQTDQPSARGAPLWPQQGAELLRLLHERGISQSALAIRCGTQRKNVNRWTKGYEFTAGNQRLAARALDLPDDHFGRPPQPRGRLAERIVAERLEAETREAYGRFLRESRVSEALTPSDLAVLRSIQFPDESVRPTKAFFEAVAYALLGAIRRDEILEVARVNAELDAQIEAKQRKGGR